MLSKRILAELIFVIHAALVLFIMFGWLVPNIWHIYLAVLILTLVSYPLFRGCVLSQLEFGLREKVNPEKKYNVTWLGHYAPSPLRDLPNIFWEVSSASFLVCALVLTLYVNVIK